MLLPDANVLSRASMKRSSRVRGVGQSVYTDTPAVPPADTQNGGGFWSWLGGAIAPVIQSTAPTLIYDAAGIPVRTTVTPSGTVTTAGQTPAATSGDTWKWVAVVGLGGLLIFMVMKRRRGGRR